MVSCLHPCCPAPRSHEEESICCFCSVTHVQLFATPWTAVSQAPLSFTIFWSLLRFMSIEMVMLSHPLPSLFFLHSFFPSIRVFSSELVLCIRWPKYGIFSFSISPSNELLFSHSVVSDSLCPHGLQQARLLCPLLSP